MKSKKSFFNRTMFFKDIIRLWPLWVIGIVITMFAFVAPFFTSTIGILRYDSLDDWQILNEIQENMAEYIIASGFYIIFMAVMAIVCAVFVFQYLNRQCSSYMLHSLPVSRKTMYVTHYLSGLFMYLLPFVLLWCVLSCLNVIFGIHMGAAILGYVLETVMIALFFYSLSCFIVMLSGSSIMNLFMYAVINFMVYVFYNMADTIINLFTYGSGSYYAGGFDIKGLVTIFSPVIYFSNALTEQSASTDPFFDGDPLLAVDGLLIGDFHYGTVILCLFYLLPAIVFFVAAYMLYRRRKLERVDENLVFPWSKVVYRIVFCCCGSYIFTCLMYYLTYAIFSHLLTYQYSYFIGICYLLIGSIVCYLICDMILLKTFFIWKQLSYLQLGVITAGIVLVFVAGHFAYLQHSTVAASKIKSVNVSFNDKSFHIKEQERMDTLLSLQKEVMEQGSKKLMYEADNPVANSNISEYQGACCNMSLTYTLKNKGEILRSYRIGITTDEEKLLSEFIMYLNDTDYLLDTVIPEGFDKENIISAIFRFVEETDDRDTSMYDDINIIYQKEMYEAVMKDLQEGHIIFGNIYRKNQRGLVDCGKRIGTIGFTYDKQPSEEDESYNNDWSILKDRWELKSSDYYNDNFNFVITDECTHVLKLLEQEMGGAVYN